MLNLFKYGLFSFPAAISLLIMQIYIPSFIAEMGIFSLTTIGIIFFAARLVDMVSDLLVGYASDKTPPEYGRRRIWILIGTPIFLLIFYQLLAIPTTVWSLFFITALWYIAGTCMIVPYYTWGTEIETGYNAHTKYTGTRVIFGLIGTLCALILPTLLMPDAPLNEVLNFNFILITLFFMIAIVLLIFLPDAGRVNAESTNLQDIILIFKKGSPFNQLIISQLFNGVANALPATLFIFFTTYVLKRSDLAGPLLVFYFLAAVISVPIWVKLTKIWPKERCWQIAMITAAVTFLAVLLVDEQTINLFIVITLITGLMAGADLSIPASMLADIIESDANKTGHRRPGIYFAVWGTTSKLTFALAIVIAFSLLGMEIFEPSQDNILVDTNWLIILYALLPSIFKILSVVLLARYNLEPRERLQ